jgi:hypothetical protein
MRCLSNGFRPIPPLSLSIHSPTLVSVDLFVEVASSRCIAHIAHIADNEGKKEVLCIQELNGPVRNIWKMPGGMVRSFARSFARSLVRSFADCQVEPGEDIAVAAVREVFEEVLCSCVLLNCRLAFARNSIQLFAFVTVTAHSSTGLTHAPHS